MQLAANILAGVFNNGTRILLQMLMAMGINLGTNAHSYVNLTDRLHITTAERRAKENTREGRMRHRQQQEDFLKAAKAAKGLLYRPGIDDSM